MWPYFFQGIGIAVGVIVGVIVTNIAQVIIQKVNAKNFRKQLVRNLRTDFQLNIKHLDRWLDQLSNYRQAATNNTLQYYTEWYDLSRAVFYAFNNMFSAGVLYDYLDFDEIYQIERMKSELSLRIGN